MYSETAPLRKIERLYTCMTYYYVFLINFSHNMRRPPPPKKPKNLHFITFWLIYENRVINYLPCCTYMDKLGQLRVNITKCG